MTHNVDTLGSSRRSVLFGTASAFAFALIDSPLSAQTSTANEILRLYGRAEPDRLSPNLQFLRLAQENRPAVPIGLDDFNVYLDNLPLMKKIKAGESLDLYHLMQWNALALDLTAQDHTNIAGMTEATYAEQFGPHRSAWALGIVHLSLFEAVNTIFRTHKSYRDIQTKIIAGLGIPGSQIKPATASVRSALAYAAYATLTVVYKNKTAYTNSVFNRLDLSNQDSDPARALGKAIGVAAAAQVLATRNYDPTTGAFNDGSKSVSGKSSLDVEPSFASLFTSPTAPLDWDIDPITHPDVALGGHWSDVTPFALDSANLFLPAGPPATSSKRFKDAYNEVRTVGGDSKPPAMPPRHMTGTVRTGTEFAPLNSSNQTLKAIFWAYDATPLLCAPPRLYNMVGASVAFNEKPIAKVENMAQFLMLINVALADAGIGAWTAKYKFHHARPVTYIRKTDPATVVLGTRNDDFTPFGAQVSNGNPTQANLTPPFPSYPSGHAVFGGALFQIMRKVLGDGAFKFVSDEYNGFNRGPVGGVRPRFERTFTNYGDAETENAQSRIWMGIHWQYDAKDGIKQGNQIADAVFAKLT